MPLRLAAGDPGPAVKFQDELKMSQQARVKAFSKFMQHVIGACMALYELITGEEPPKLRDLLRGA